MADHVGALQITVPDGAPCTLVHEWFVRAARRWPDRIAVDVPPGRARPDRTQTTYAQLDRQSDALARRVSGHLAAESIVGILLPRASADLYAAQLAVLKAGGAYVCLDPVFPAERMRDILADAEVQVLVTDAPGADRAAAEGFACAVVVDAALDTGLASRVGGGVADAPAWLGPSSLAYLIYTSGSTGRPKGVMIEHRGVVNLIASDVEAFGLGPGDRVAQNSSAAYDSSVEETWLALACGATLVVMDDDTVRLGPDLVPWLRREHVAVFCPSPTLLRAMGRDDPASSLPELQLLYLGGEALPQDLADHWAHGCALINGYGPTECTVTCIREQVTAGEAVSIGRPIEGTSAWVLDASLQVAPDGVQGELCIGGIGLARGYWQRPDLTADRFPTVPGLGRVYRTGDLAHRDEAGRFFYHGRLDAQVKIRGYRVELGDIEAHLARCPGVRAAACRLQDDDGHGTLVGFIVPEQPGQPPALDAIKVALAASLPTHMVPARLGLIAALPTTVGGKLDRAMLPVLKAGEGASHGRRVLPRDAMEARLDAALTAVMRGRGLSSLHDDFFDDLGGDSLTAAEFVTRLRDDPETAWVTVRDVYEARTVAALAALARGHVSDDDGRLGEPSLPMRRVYPRLVTIAQALWLVAIGVVSSTVTYWVAFQAIPWLVARLGVVPFVLLAPALGVVGFAIYTPCVVLLTAATKRLLIGRYRAMRVPVWSGGYLRHWMVEEMARLIPWRRIEGTPLQVSALRALGARIGQRVDIHRGVDLRRGGWDLLEIGDDVTIGRDAAVRVADVEAGHVVFGPVVLRDGATLDTRAGVARGGVLDAGAWLTALSSLPPGGRVPADEQWDGVPARPAGSAPVPPPLPADARVLSPHVHGLVMLAARAGVGVVQAIPVQVLAITTCRAFDLDADTLWALLSGPAATWTPWVIAMTLTVVSVPLTLAWSAVVSRLLGRVSPGVISRWSPAYVRVSLKVAMLERAGEWLSGTLGWPMWLRLAGMQVGRGCEISTIIDVVPELISIGPETFFADGIYLGGPRIQQGTVTLAATSLGANTFLGNHAVVVAGQSLPSDILLGVSTPADDRRIRPGSSWFGHPPFELPRREVVTVDRHLTHEPSAIRYGNRVCWELLRFALPTVPLLVLVAWTRTLAAAADASPRWMLGVVVPAATFGAAATPAVLALALKWALLGRVRPGQHPLWSCWCSRWDFLYVAWGQWARLPLERLEGTLLLTWYLRLMGMRIGRRVVLGPGFSQVVDPDMITLEDDATVSAMFQAHTFEDRVLKIDRVVIGRGATVGAATVPLYGAVIGEGAHVASHSVVMKRERLLPHVHYEGVPTRPQGPARMLLGLLVVCLLGGTAFAQTAVPVAQTAGPGLQKAGPGVPTRPTLPPAEAPDDEDDEPRLQAGITFDTNFGDGGTWVQITPTVGYTISDRWSVEAGLPLYHLAASATEDGTTVRGLGDLYASLTFDGSTDSTTAWVAGTIGAPTGDADQALGAGTPTWDVSGYLDRAFGKLTPSTYVGVGNNSLVAASSPSRQLYRSSGLIVHAEGWGEVEVVRMLRLAAGVYLIRQTETVVIDGEEQESADDEGFQFVATSPLTRALELSFWFSRSTPYDYNTYSVSLGIDLVALFGKSSGSAPDRKRVRR